MQILEHNISFADRLVITFNQTKRAVQLFVLAIIMIWFVVWLVEADFAGALASRRLISCGVTLSLIILYTLASLLIFLFVKNFCRSYRQFPKGIKKGAILTNALDLYLIEPNIAESEFNYQMSLNEYDLVFDAKWIFKVNEFAYATQPTRLIKRVGRGEEKVPFRQEGVGEMAGYLYKMDSTLYDSFVYHTPKQINTNPTKAKISITPEEIIIAKSAQSYMKEVAQIPVKVLYDAENPEINCVLIDAEGKILPLSFLSKNSNNLSILVIFALAVAAYLVPIYLVGHSIIFDSELYIQREKP
jgi:hypothetical protein